MLLQSFLSQALGYFAVVGAVFLVVWRWGRRRSVTVMAKRKAPAAAAAAGRSRRRGEPVVRRVLEVTLEQLAARGYAELSIPEIAAAAGLNKTSVYRRWPTKAELVQEALRVSLGHAEPPPDSGDLRQDMLAMAKTAVGFARSPLGLGVLRTLLAEGANPELRAIADAMIQARDGSGPRCVLERAIERGELPAGTDVRLILSVIAGTVVHRLLVEQGRLTGAELQRLVDLVLYGVVGRGGVRGKR